MTDARPETRCPRCGTETGIRREGQPVLPGGLRLHEFEVLVRNEWRRRLGPEAYGRTHARQLVARLTRSAAQGPDCEDTLELDDEVMRLIAEIRAAGKGRAAIQREVVDLLWAIRSVLLGSGVEPSTASSFVSRAGAALDAALRNDAR